MRAVVQRVSQARITGSGLAAEIIAEIGVGLCVLVGVGKADTEEHARNMAKKIAALRIFEDAQGRLNRSVSEIGGEALVVSQFTLYGDCRKGNRPSFSEAAPPAQAENLYDCFVAQLRASGIRTSTGRFQTAMKVALVNNGPVTLVLEN
jgi:D-tyrosyl-tRNA(Tyr) deacylase